MKGVAINLPGHAGSPIVPVSSHGPKIDGILVDQLHGTEILIQHDPAAQETPFVRSAGLAARMEGTTIVPLQDLGHTGPLADRHVIGLVTDHITEQLARSAGFSGNTR